MRARMFEVRHGDDVYSAMALEMGDEVSRTRVELLKRAGHDVYPPRVMIMIVDRGHEECHSEIEEWQHAWQKNVHAWVRDHFIKIYDGFVVDADYLLGEREEPRVSALAS